MNPDNQWQAVVLHRQCVPEVFSGEGPLHFLVMWTGKTLAVALTPKKDATLPTSDTWVVGVDLSMEGGLVYVFPPEDRTSEARSPQWISRVHNIARYLQLYVSCTPSNRDWITILAAMFRGGPGPDSEVTQRDLAQIVWVAYALIPWILGAVGVVQGPWAAWRSPLKFMARPIPPILSPEAFFTSEELARGSLLFEDRYASLRFPDRAFFSVRTQEHAPERDKRVPWKGTWDELSSGVFLAVVRQTPAQVQPFVLGDIEERHHRSLDWVTKALKILLEGGYLDDPLEIRVEDRALQAHGEHLHFSQYPVRLTEQVIRAVLRALHFGSLWPEWVAATQPDTVVETMNEA